jgi:hypothetical protein
MMFSVPVRARCAAAIAVAVLLLLAPAARADHATGASHAGPATAGVHSLRIRSGVDPATPAWPVVTPHSAYAPALAGTAWIAPNPSLLCNGAAPPTGFLTTVTTTFDLPASALDPGIVVLVQADDSVAVRLNGQLLGGQHPAVNSANYKGSPEAYTDADYAPGGPFVAGTNTLQFEHRNYGGVCGLNYLAVVTFGFFSCPRNNPGGIIAGGPGNDVLTGTPGDDLIVGGDGDDVLNGGGGDDIIVGGAGNDTILGGPGDDCILGEDGADLLLGGDGNDTLFGLAGDDAMSGGPGDDLLDGGAGSDSLRGDDGVDVLFGSDGSDALQGDAGNDLVFGGPDDDVMAGGDGSDGLIGGPGADSVADPSGGDVDALNGGDGADSLNTSDGDGQDTIWGPLTGGFFGLLDPNDTCLRDGADYAFGCP